MRVLQLICFFALFECCFFNGFSQNVLSPYPIDACTTYTFRTQMGDAAFDNHINDIYGNSTGNSFQVGYTTMNGNQQDGLLQQLDINGKVLWSKTFGSNTLNERIQSIGKLPDATLVITGTIENVNGTNQRPFVAAVDMTGTILWMRSIQTPTDYRGAYVLATKSGTIGMVAEDDSTMLYGRFNISGNLAWLKKVQALPKSKTVGMAEDVRWFITYAGEEAGRRIGGIIVIDSLTGNIERTRQFGGAATNSDFIFHSVQMINIRPRITGIFSENNQPYRLFRMSSVQSNDFNTVRLFETFNTPAIAFDVTAFSTQSLWSESIAFTPSTASNDLYVLTAKGDEEVYSHVAWARQFSNMSAYSLAAIDRVFDAGYLVTLNGKATAAPFTPVLSIKVDSAGLASTGCEGADFNIEKINTETYPAQTVNLTPVTMNFPVQQESYLLQPLTINTQYLCNALNCPPKPVEDTCVTTFYRAFRSTHFADGVSDMTVSANNEVIVNGGMRDNPIDPLAGHGMLASFDAKGKLVARKKLKFGNGTTSYLSKQYRLADGNILILGSSSYNNVSYVTVSKYTPALTLLWSQSFQLFYLYYSGIYDLIESSDGSIFVWYLEGNSIFTTPKPQMLKLDASGNILWSRSFQLSSNIYLSFDGSMCQDNQYIYAACGTVAGNYATMLIKIEKATGNLVWAKQYKGPGYQTDLYTRIQLYQNNILLTGFVSPPTGYGATALVPIDKDGNILSVTTFNYNNSGPIGTKALVTQNNEIVVSGYITDFSRAPYTGFITFLRLDPKMQVLYSKRAYSEKPASAFSLREATDGGIYEAGGFYYTSYTSDFYLKKYAYDGTMGNCISETVAYNRSTINITATPMTVITATPANTTATLPYVEEDYSLQQNKLLCSSPVTCFKPTLTGPQQICNSGNTIEYRAQRIPGCTAPVSWDINPSQLKVISSSDTLLKVQFIANGTTRIRAGVFSGCRWLQDSMDVVSTISSITLDLGPDSNLCTGNTIQLNARKGFASYTWHDGSVDSLFTITHPGKYYVTTTDGCGSIYSDTVNVFAAPPIPFELGPDRDICNNERIAVTAPAGFLHYSWSPAYNISSTTAQTTDLFPSIDTIYYISAEKTPGCFAYDSVRIFVKQPIPVNLGNDTSFCAGNTLLLDAGNNFQQYQWNNGATAATLPVTTSGTYSIITTAANSCHSYDTIQVTVFANPVITLSKDSLLCEGDSKIYDAGNGYSQYEWQDGSTASSFVATTIGKYWVKVTDQHGCTRSDTAVISRIVLLPSGFLPPDTALCTYARLELKPRNTFLQYLWSTAAITSSITIQKAGLYWLQVTDRYNCVGRDSIMIVPKDCLYGLFIPNAFTPDGDGRNDIFKPVVMGNAVRFEFSIFNRWGQRVFQSTNWQTGWDGTLAGKQQGNDTYIWTCTYQFENEPVKFERGNVSLVR